MKFLIVLIIRVQAPHRTDQLTLICVASLIRYNRGGKLLFHILISLQKCILEHRKSSPIRFGFILLHNSHFYIMRSISIPLLALLLVLVNCRRGDRYHGESVRLTDIDTLTFYDNKYTTGYRSK